jgi:hypothetical protein
LASSPTLRWTRGRRASLVVIGLACCALSLLIVEAFEQVEELKRRRVVLKMFQ